MRTLIRAVLAAAMLAAIPLSAHSQEGPSASPGLSPGDMLRVAVWRNLEFSGDFMVGADGTILHPLYREIQVTGVPLSVVEERVRAFLTRYIATPQFVIQPLVRIVVAGEVRTPNVYSVPVQTTVAQALALAGGPTERANLSRVSIIRDGQEVRLDLRGRDMQVAQIQTRSGDYVVVGRKSTVFRDIVLPVVSTVAAVAGVVNIFMP